MKPGDKIDPSQCNGKVANANELYAVRESYVVDRDGVILSVHRRPADALVARKSQSLLVHFGEQP